MIQLKKEDRIVNRLLEAGFEAYFVGGCVRDELLGLPHGDIDITTNATPDQVMDIFQDMPLNFVGKRFGVTLVDGVEVATFRTEIYPVPSKPDVQFVSSLYEDLSRRDFTVNAMVKRKDGSLVDYFGGKWDLEKEIIRSVGEPLKRFTEDPSRILRGIYLASYLGFDIEKDTRRTMKEHAEMLDAVPVELKGAIVDKVIKRNCLSEFLLWLRELDLLPYVFPYLSHTVGLKQNPKYHNSDVFEHIVRVVQSAEKRYPGNRVMLLGALMHDDAKGLPGIRGVNKEMQPNDLNHEEAGVPIAKKALTELQFGRDVVAKVLFIVEFHGLRLPENAKEKSLLKAIRKLAPSFHTKGELKEGIQLLFDFMECDAEGFEPAFGNEIIRVNKVVKKRLKEVVNGTIFYRSELPIDGRFIAEYGYVGKEIGEVLDLLVRENLQDQEQIAQFLSKKRRV